MSRVPRRESQWIEKLQRETRADAKNRRRGQRRSAQGFRQGPGHHRGARVPPPRHEGLWRQDALEARVQRRGPGIAHASDDLREGGDATTCRDGRREGALIGDAGPQMSFLFGASDEKPGSRSQNPAVGGWEQRRHQPADPLPWMPQGQDGGRGQSSQEALQSTGLGAQSLHVGEVPSGREDHAAIRQLGH